VTRQAPPCFVSRQFSLLILSARLVPALSDASMLTQGAPIVKGF